MRNAEPGTERTQVVRRTLCPGSNSARSVPRSAFRVPRSGWGSGGAAVRVGVDVGGTFTDLVALAQDGTIEVRKVVTTPDDPAVGLFRDRKSTRLNSSHGYNSYAAFCSKKKKHSSRQ